jgi:hypothetical protein
MIPGSSACPDAKKTYSRPNLQFIIHHSAPLGKRIFKNFSFKPLFLRLLRQKSEKRPDLRAAFREFFRKSWLTKKGHGGIIKRKIFKSLRFNIRKEICIP